MKKIFTIAVALMASMAMMADIYASWQFSGSTAPAVNSSETGTNMTVEFYTSDSGKSFSNESAAYNTAVTDDMKSQGSKGIKLGANALYLKVTVEGGYIAGDTISICGYKPWKISSSAEHTGDIAASVATGTSKTDYNIGSFILNEDADELYLMRAESTGTCIAAIRVNRAEGATPSTDPVLNVAPAELTLAATAAQPQVSANVTFTGKNLAAGNYALTLPNVAGLSAEPASVTVGEDGKLNAEVTLSYTSDVNVAAASTAISLTIGELTKNVTVNYSADLAKNYLNRSMNIEQLVLDNGTGYNIKAAFAAANIEYNNIDALDTLNDLEDKSARNYAFLGLKMKKSDAALRCWLQQGHTISVRFGNVGANFLVRANGQAMTLTNAMANTTVESDTALTVTAPMDMYLEIICNSTKTLVIKQIMLDEAIAPVTLPDPNAYLITIAESEHGTVTATWDNKKYRTPVGATVTLNFAPAEGYIVMHCYVNETEIFGEPNQPITFEMPAEDVTITTVFDLPTAVDNAETAVTAVKVIRNGQLLIEKNGILYNAQGTTIR